MFLNAQAFFKDMTPGNTALLIRAKTDIPAEFIRLYKRNVVDITPKKTGALRRSIITRQSGGTAEISWRSPYAVPQNEGGHFVPRPVRGPNTRDGGYGTIAAGFYRYRNYTTPGTGPRFANIAFQRTQKEMPAVMRQLGLTK